MPAQGPAEVVEVSEAINSLAGALRNSEGRQRSSCSRSPTICAPRSPRSSGYAESLADGVVPPEQTGQVGTVMLGEAKRLERLVGDLLDLARLTRRTSGSTSRRSTSSGWCTAPHRSGPQRCAAAGVVFRLETPDPPVIAVTDSARVRQVLDGLFDNALRVTPSGAPIVLAARIEPGEAVVEVRDGGPGLSDADLPVAFDHGVLVRALPRRATGGHRVGAGDRARPGRPASAGTIEAGHAHGGRRTVHRAPPPDRLVIGPFSGP